MVVTQPPGTPAVPTTVRIAAMRNAAQDRTDQDGTPRLLHYQGARGQEQQTERSLTATSIARGTSGGLWILDLPHLPAPPSWGW